jgi:hypothetical protein
MKYDIICFLIEIKLQDMFMKPLFEITSALFFQFNFLLLKTKVTVHDK